MPVNLDTNIGTLRLPVQLNIGHIEEVTCSDNFLGGHAHHADSCGTATHFGSPETQQLLVLLDTFTLRRRGGPLKVHHSINLNGRLTQQVHSGRLVDGNRLVLEHSRHVLLIGRPLESRPLHLLLGLRITLAHGASGQIVGNKRPQRLPRGNIPNDNVLSILLVCENRLALFDLDRTSGPSGHVIFKGREFDELHKRMRELLLF